MPLRCAAVNCSQQYDKENGITLHGFPSDPVLRKEWAVKVRRADGKGNLWIPPLNSRGFRVCSKHFEDSCFDRLGQTVRLRQNAVPTIFDFPDHLKAQQDNGGRKPPHHHATPSQEEAVAASVAASFAPASAASVADDHGYCMPEASELKRRLDAATDRAETLAKDVRSATVREKRLRSTVASLLDQLQAQSLLTAELKAQLAVYSDIPTDLFARTENQYSQEQREFSLSLYLHGPKAYSYLRDSVKIPLPHPRSLRRWLESVDASPGISSVMIDHLRVKAQEDSNNYTNCTLMLDGMSLRQHIGYDASKDRMVGFVDLGNGQTDEPANDVLVMMVVGTTGHWKAPIAFFLNHGLTATTQSQLILLTLSKLHEAGLKVRAITMDGHGTNFGMCAELGCDIRGGQTSFVDPASGRAIYVMFDACHMQKLLRNMLKAFGTVASANGTIEWRYIQELQEMQDGIGLRLGNKLSRRHIDFQNNKMKVSVSVQTLSLSVATALRYLQQAGIPRFRGVTATVEFITRIDEVLDILNSRSKFGKGCKAPLTPENYAVLTAKVEDHCAYLATLTTKDGTPIRNSRRFMCVLGTVTTLRSLLLLAPALFLEQEYILSYKFSQDHIELFFGAVRRAGGWNNNPSAAHFMATFRHLLCRCTLSPGRTGNVTQLDPTSILAVGHTSRQRDPEIDERDQTAPDTALDLPDHDFRPSLSPIVGNIVTYMAGFVVRKALERLECATCREALVTREEPDDFTALYHLLRLKNRGGLLLPSKGAVKVVLTAEQELRHHTPRLDSAQSPVPWRTLESAVLRQVGAEDVFGLGGHVLETQYGLDNHGSELVRMLVSCYRRVRLHHQARLHTARLQRGNTRQKLTKLTLFRGH